MCLFSRKGKAKTANRYQGLFAFVTLGAPFCPFAYNLAPTTLRSPSTGPKHIKALNQRQRASQHLPPKPQALPTPKPLIYPPNLLYTPHPHPFHHQPLRIQDYLRAQWLSGTERRGVGPLPPPRIPARKPSLLDDRGREFDSPAELNPYAARVFVAPGLRGGWG